MLLEEFTTWEIEELIDYEEELAEGSRKSSRRAASLTGLPIQQPSDCAAAVSQSGKSVVIFSP
jgi:hypothetical protein